MSVKAGDIVFDIRGDDKKLLKTLGGVQKHFGATSKAIGIAMTAAGAAITGVIAGIGRESLKASADINNAALRMVASLGLPKEAAEKFREMIRTVYGENFGDSIEDVGQAIQTVATALQTVGSTAEDEITAATIAALALRDTFGTGVSETIGAVTGLIQNFGITGQEAFDFITHGMQNGLNKSGDFLDSIGEYSTQFAEGGATAAQFFSMMETGMQSGMLGTDKAADAFKEFRVRLLDGSKGTNEALQMLGMNIGAIESQMSNGSLTMIEAWDLVIGKIAQVTNEGTKMQIGVALLGTQYEDLGAKTVLAMNSGKTSMEDMEKATQSLMVQYETLGDDIKGFKRKVELAGEALINSIAPHLNQIIDLMAPFIDRFVEWTKANMDLASTLTWVGAAVGAVFLIAGPLLILLPGIATAFAGITAISWPMVAAIVGIGTALGALGYAAYNSMETWSGWEGLWAWVTGLFDSARSWFEGNFAQITAIFSNATDAILLTGGILWESLKIGFNLLWSVLSNVFSELGEGFVSLSDTTGTESETVLGTIERLSNLMVEYLGFMSKEIQLFSDFMGKIWPLISTLVWIGTNLILEPIFFLVDKLIWAFEQVAWAGNGIADILAGVFGAGGGFAGGVNIGVPVGAATGGVIDRGGWAMVGERGPELVQLPRGATVYDNQQTESARSGGGAASIVINNSFSGVVNANDLSRIIAEKTYDEMRARGI